MDRRHFVQLCAGTAFVAALGRNRPALAGPIESFAPARLVKGDGSPLKASDVGTDEALVFAYPYEGIPCFLINLGAQHPQSLNLASPDDGDYTSPAGVGNAGSLIAFVAICTHQLSYPKPDISVIRYAASDSALAHAPSRIVCCAHGSVFSPANGGQHVAGPARNPLQPVQLAYDPATDGLTATGAVGEKFFQRFFDAYKSDLIERFGPGKYRRPVDNTSKAIPLSQYSKVVSDC